MIIEPIKVLLVDDVEDNLLALEALLRREGLDILKAQSGSEALELLLVHDIALAFLDVFMPHMDGFELAESIRGADRTKHVPIIFVTAGPKDHRRIFRGYESGAVDFLYKPIDPHILKGKADVFLELYREKRDLSNALRLNEMFVGIVGHDLRNPLGTILNGAQLLARRLEDDDDCQIAERMIAAGRRMSGMIEQLLDLTRARLAGGLGFLRVRRRLDIGNLVRRTVEELRGAYPNKEVTVEIAGDCSTTGDGDRLQQLFSNLIGNALHHGTGTSVSVHVAGGGQNVALRVRNQGELSEDFLPTIFDPFQRRAGTARQSAGLGLGLYISQQIALAHGGDIAADSADGETVFTVTIPQRSIAGRVRASTGLRDSILIVDDDESIRDSLRDVFEEEGYTVTTAANGEEALKRLSHPAFRPDVVILDLLMPVLDGGRVFQAMQMDRKLADIPVIVSTANPLRAPFGAVVVRKPVKLDRLLQTVGDLLQEDQRTT